MTPTSPRAACASWRSAGWEREVERLKTELELENDQVAKAEIARIKQRQVGVGQGEPAGTRTAAKPTADVATSATRGSNDAVVRRVSIDGVTGSGGVVGNPLNLPGAAVGVQNW